MAITAEDQIIHHLKDKVGLTEADKLVAQFKAEVLEEIGADDPVRLRKRADDIMYGPSDDIEK